MWALVKASQVIEIIGSPKNITVNNVAHPKGIFISWSKTDLKKIGIYEFVSGSTPDSRFETPTTTSYKVDTSKGTVTETINKKDKAITDTLWTSQDKTDKKIPEDEDVGDVANEGLKSFYKKKIKSQATALLRPTDWMVVRKAEDSSKSIPSAVTTFRTSVRKKADAICTEIDNCSSLTKLKKLFDHTYNSDGTIKTVSTMGSMPNDKSIKQYKR